MHHRCACVLWSLQHRLVRQKQIVHQWFVVWLYCRLKCTIYQHPQVPTSNYHGPPIPTSAHPYGHTTRPIHYCHRAVQYGRTTGPIHHCYLVADYNMCIVTETKKELEKLLDLMPPERLSRWLYMLLSPRRLANSLEGAKFRAHCTAARTASSAPNRLGPITHIYLWSNL